MFEVFGSFAATVAEAATGVAAALPPRSDGFDVSSAAATSSRESCPSPFESRRVKASWSSLRQKCFGRVADVGLPGASARLGTRRLVSTRPKEPMVSARRRIQC